MKFIALFSSLALFAVSSFADTVSFDNTYDNAGGRTDTTACSNGPHGLSSRFPTFGSMPSFPRIGGAQAVGGFDSVNCGTCWSLTFNGTTINVLAIDVAAAGFNIAQAAMDQLTHNQAVFLGRINATAAKVNASACGL